MGGALNPLFHHWVLTNAIDSSYGWGLLIPAFSMMACWPVLVGLMLATTMTVGSHVRWLLHYLNTAAHSTLPLSHPFHPLSQSSLIFGRKEQLLQMLCVQMSTQCCFFLVIWTQMRVYYNHHLPIRRSELGAAQIYTCLRCLSSTLTTWTLLGCCLIK